MQRHRAEPDNEARLVEPDECSFGLIEHEQRDASSKQDDRRDHGHGRDEHTYSHVRRPAAHILLAPQVVAQSAPARARKLQGDDGDEKHSDECVHRQKRLQIEQRRTLDC
jgi:hypothetical protein